MPRSHKTPVARHARLFIALMASLCSIPISAGSTSLQSTSPPSPPTTAEPPKPEPTPVAAPEPADAESPEPAEAAKAPTGPAEIVVYCTVAPEVARPLFETFQHRTKVHVRPVFASESTIKLVERFRSEHRDGHVQADLWFGDTPLEAIALAAEGLLSPYQSESADRHAGDAGWPKELRDTAGKDAAEPRWYAFGRRLRVLAYNTNLASADELPADLAGLAAPRWRGRVGIAGPGCSPALMYLAAINVPDHPSRLRDWLTSMKAAEVRLFADDDAVAAALARGEIELGLTSSDAAIRVASVSPIRFRVATAEKFLTSPGELTGSTRKVHPAGAQVPHAIGIAQGGPSRDNAELLVDYLLCNEVGEILARGPSAAFTLPEQTYSGMSRYCDGAIGPARAARLLIELDGLNLEGLAAQTAAVHTIWNEVWPTTPAPK